MKNLAHSASFESLDKDAPSNAGTKQLVPAFGQRPLPADCVEKLRFSTRSQLSRPPRRFEKILAGDPAENSGRQPVRLGAAARADSGSTERKREAMPFFGEGPIQWFFNTIRP
jgi:hypothetical protein